MATGILIKNCSDEATCSLCLEYFKDPVSVDCGHNFCKVCITQCLEKGKPSCPQCRQTISQRNFRPSQQLANLVVLIKKLQLVTQEEGKCGVCGKHQEPLKLFCKEDEMCICLVCHLSKEHKDHNVLPVEEASQEYKQLQTILEENKSSWLSWLDDLEKKRKENWEENAGKLLDQITDLCSQIAEMEEKCQQPAGEFLQV
uniref:RING-type E3 ubiquitin transferase n=1 Tax=Salvator merianae TaxID=96440 RepID=A0A8D0BPT8_SALMN